MNAFGTRPIALTLALVLGLGPAADAEKRAGPISVPADASTVSAALAEDVLQDLASSLDYDVERVFRFVADEIAYEPYAGLLRGPKGTLEARAGNSVDQAALLAALLDASLVTFRFATGPLDQAAAADILESTVIDGATAGFRADAVLVGGQSDDTGADPSPASADAEAFATQLEADAARVADIAGGQLDRSVAAIEAALETAGHSLPGATSPIPGLETEAHTWVQVAWGTDWLDLDPTLPEAMPGDTATSAAAMLDSLPDELRHRVLIAATLETVGGAGLDHQTIIEFEAYADAITDMPITFAHMKPDGLENMGITVGRLVGEAQAEYDPVLAVGQATLVGSPAVTFGTTGTDLFGEEVETSGPGLGEAIAEWLEVRVTSPDGRSVTSRRTIFDRLDPATRASVGEPPRSDAAEDGESTAASGALGADVLAAIPPIELVDLDDANRDEYPPMRAVHSFAVVTGPRGIEAVLDLPVGTENIGLLSSVGRAYHWLRDALAAEVALDRGLRPFIDGPNVISWSLGVDAPVGAEPTATLGLDIWHRNLGVLPVAGASPAGDPAVVAGVLSHVAERVSMRDGFGTLDEETPPSVGVGTITDAAIDQGIGLMALSAADSLPAEVDPLTRQRIAAAIASGDLVVAPTRPVALGGRDHFGWWRVDPATGRTVDEMPGGAGSQTEYPIPVNTSFRVAMCLVALSEKIVASIALGSKYLGAGDAALALGGIAIALWVANFFNPGWAKTCRGA